MYRKLECIATIALLLLSCGRVSSGLPTDQELQVHFETHYQEFEELKNLCLSLQSGDANQLNLDRESRTCRLSELRVKLGCEKISITKDFILIIFQERNGYRSSCDKGYLYCAEKRTGVLPNKVDLEQIFQSEEASSNILIKELKGNWYMQLAYDY